MSAPTALLAHEWLADRVGDMTDLLDELVAIETPSTEPATLASLQDRVEEVLADLGFTARRVPGIDTAGWSVAHRSCDPPLAAPQLLVGHLDTVWPVGTLASRDDIGRDGARYRGPGSYDMKAGIVQLCFALQSLEALGLPLAVPPVVLCNTDEEIGSRESTPAIVALARHADRVYVMEPSLGPSGRIKTQRKGVGRFSITVAGRAAHAGLDPGVGASAILELSHVIQSVFAMNDPDAGVSVNVGTIDGGLRPNVVAPVSTAVVDVRVPTHDDAARIEAAFAALRPATPGTTLHVVGGFGRPPMERTAGTAALWSLAAEAAAHLGVVLEEATAGGGSDGNTTAVLAPTLDGLGAVGDGAHARDEHVELDRMAERTAVLAALLAAPPVTTPAPTLPRGGVPTLVADLPTPAQVGPITGAEAVRDFITTSHAPTEEA